MEPNAVPTGNSGSIHVLGKGFGKHFLIVLDSRVAAISLAATRVRVGDLLVSDNAVRRVSATELDLEPGNYDISVQGQAAQWVTLPRALTVEAEQALPSARDAGSRLELDVRDAGHVAPTATCAPLNADAESLLLLDFEEGIGDSARGQNTELVGAAMRPLGVGPAGCGSAFILGPGQHVRIDDSEQWDLTTGAIDFWFAPEQSSEGDPLGILSRDANGEAFAGHITVYHLGGGSGRLMVRLQDGDTYQFCSDAPLEVDHFVYVGFNFGPPGLDSGSTAYCRGSTATCPT